MFPNRDTPEQKRKELRKFGLLVGGILALIGLLFLWRGRHEIARIVLWSIGGFLIVFGAIAPIVLKPIYVAWMKFAFVLGWVNSRILLSIIFFVFFTPMALIQRVFGRDALHRRMEKGTNSYWIKRSPIASIKEHCERQF
ncbi:hypothetical protein IH992_09005 [Candidatus Poribacteria bacterium]|nr:hypothetical protein [Candidatus Poribacteria bacterium]